MHQDFFFIIAIELKIDTYGCICKKKPKTKKPPKNPPKTVDHAYACIYFYFVCQKNCK